MKTRFSNCTKRLLKHVNFLRPWERHLLYRTIKNNEMQSSCHVNTDHYHLENKQKKVIQSPYTLSSFGLQIQPVGISIFTLSMSSSFISPCKLSCTFICQSHQFKLFLFLRKESPQPVETDSSDKAPFVCFIQCLSETPSLPDGIYEGKKKPKRYN